VLRDERDEMLANEVVVIDDHHVAAEPRSEQPGEDAAALIQPHRFVD
jgi:hypothetical protein